MQSSLSAVAFEVGLEYIENFSEGYTTFFHYTNKNAKDRIVASDSYTFRLTKVSEFADKNEGLHILEPYRHSCGKLYNEDKIDADFYNTIKDITIKNSSLRYPTPWVLCLTMNGYSKYMKERYAPKDGYVIGLQATALFDLIEFGDCDIGEVLYSSLEVESTIQGTLLRLYAAYTTDTSEREEKCNILKNAINNLLFRLNYFYKSEEFKNEEEVRAVIYLKRGFTEWNYKDELCLYKNTEDKKLYLRMGIHYQYCETTELEKWNTRELNKGMFTFDEIRRVYRSE